MLGRTCVHRVTIVGQIVEALSKLFKSGTFLEQHSDKSVLYDIVALQNKW